MIEAIAAGGPAPRLSRSPAAVLAPLLTSILAAVLAWPHRSLAKPVRHAAAARPARADTVAAFERHMLPLLDAAYSFARYLARDPDAAHDIVQEAYLRAYRAHDGFRGGDPRAWLFAIVRNCHRDWEAGRRRTRDVEVGPARTDPGEDGPPEAASDEDDPETALARKSEAERVRSILQGLPQPFREVLVLRELEDLSYREIATVTDLPIGTVMSRLARARDAFGAAWRGVTGEGCA